MLKTSNFVPKNVIVSVDDNPELNSHPKKAAKTIDTIKFLKFNFFFKIPPLKI